MIRFSLISSVGLFGCINILAAESLPVIEDSISINRFYFEPGQTLNVIIPKQVRKSPFLVLGDQNVPFYDSPDKNWRALVAIPLENPIPQYEGKIDFSRSDIHKFTGPFTITVSTAGQPTERLVFSKEKAALLNDPAEDKESRIIRETLKRISDEKKQLWNGIFKPPHKGEVISSFGIRRDKVGQIKPDIHRGVDVKATKGDDVNAPANGRVVLTENFAFHGKTIILSHGQGVGSIYIHLDEIQVKVGEKLTQGDTIGLVGSTGLATAPHLHWGMYVHGQPVDPHQWLKESF